MKKVSYCIPKYCLGTNLYFNGVRICSAAIPIEYSFELEYDKPAGINSELEQISLLGCGLIIDFI